MPRFVVGVNYGQGIVDYQVVSLNGLQCCLQTLRNYWTVLTFENKRLELLLSPRTWPVINE